MSKFTRTLLALSGAIIMLGAFVSAASANRLSSSVTTGIRATWTSMEFVEPLGQVVRCPVTLEGSLHSATITKTAGLLIGYINRASLTNSSCVGGHATILTETLPWHQQYSGFEGNLPSITAVKINTIGSKFRVEGPFGNCLFTSTTTQPVTGRYNLSAGAVTSVSVSGSITSGGENCGPFGERVTGNLRGTSSSNTAQTIRLI